MSYSTLNTHGITTQTVKNFIIDAGAVYYFDETDKENPANWTLLGATRDGNSFTVEQEIRIMEIDGVKGNLKNARRITSVNPQITANLIEMSSAGFIKALPGASAEDFPTETATHDQITRALEIADTDYMENIALVGEVHGKSQPFIGIIKNGLADGNLEISTAEEDEAGLSITFTGHFEDDDLETEPWEILYPKADSPIISTTSEIVEDQTDPSITVELTGDTFESEADAENTDNWTFGAGETGLTLSEILYIDDDTVVVSLDSTGADSGTTDAGTITLTAKAAALSGSDDSNELSLTVQ